MNSFEIKITTTVTVDGEEKVRSIREDESEWFYSGCRSLPANDGDCDGKAKVEIRAGAKEGMKLLVIKAANESESTGAGGEGEATSGWQPAYPKDENGCPQLKFKTRHKLPNGDNRDSEWIPLEEDRFFDPYSSDQLYANDVEELEWLIFKNTSTTAIGRIEVCVARGEAAD